MVQTKPTSLGLQENDLIWSSMKKMKKKNRELYRSLTFPCCRNKTIHSHEKKDSKQSFKERHRSVDEST